MNSRTFSIAMTAWSAKVSSSSICLSENGSDLASATIVITPIGIALAQHRHGQDASGCRDPTWRERARVTGNSVSGSARRSSTWIVRRSADRPAASPVAAGRHGLPDASWRPAASPCLRHVAQDVPSKRKIDRIRARRTPAHAFSAIGVEHRLDVGRRARDHPQDLGRRRLLLQRLGQLGGSALSELREQTDVLDGDHGLVGEGLEERDLLGREGLRRRVPD